jgi:two-component system cell cycle response regulator
MAALAVDRHQSEVVTAGVAAMAKAAETPYELIIVSLLMRESDGLRLCAALRSQEATRHVPILALVEEGDHDRLARALDLGVNDYLLRPIDKNELVARVRTQIRRRRYQEQLRADYERSMSLALTDTLTGLYNRRYASSHLATELEQAVRSGKALGLLLIDIDHFKSINDTHGHSVGDEVLRAVANRLSRHLRAFDTVARWGGEEFVVVMPEAPLDVARSVAERLRRKVAGGPVTVSGGAGDVTVTVSIGVAVTGEGTSTMDDLLRGADAAMYFAKRNGRNRVATVDDLAPRQVAANS